MFSFRDLLIFLAGAEFFHTLSHILIPYFINLPITTKYLILTPNLNRWAIIINALITIALLWWAKRRSRKSY